MYPLLQPQWVGMRRGQEETLSWPRASYWLQTCSPASPISIALDIKDNGPVTTQQECRRSPQLGMLKAKRQEGPFKYRSLMQPHLFGLHARAAGEIPHAVFRRRTASGPQWATALGQEICKNLLLGSYTCQPIAPHRQASKEEQTNYNRSIPSNRAEFSFHSRGGSWFLFCF